VSGPEEPDAAAAALARARAKAAEAGLRPGSVPPRRRRVGSGADAGGRRDGRDFALIGDQVDSIVADRGWDVDVAAGSVMGRWPQIVGVEVAAHAAPVTFEDGVLTVRCDSTAWATQLRLMQSRLLSRITEDIGPGIVVELRVVGPSAPSWSRGPRRASDGRGPRDTYG
jgi:predicted nucleic acid-binding Zn ribbon protein